MTVQAIPGASCTFKFGATAYSTQVTGYDFDSQATIARTKTLTTAAYPKVDGVDNVTVNYLYDGEDGFVGALKTAKDAGTETAIELVIGDSKWTGSMVIENMSGSVSADGPTTGSVSLVGEPLTLADAP